MFDCSQVKLILPPELISLETIIYTF